MVTHSATPDLRDTPEHPAELVRRVTLLIIGSTVLFTPIGWAYTGVWGLTGAVVSILAFSVVLNRHRIGDLDGTTRSFVVVNIVLIPYFVASAGGLQGWGVVFLVNLPLLGVLLGGNAWRAGAWSVGLVSALIAVLYALPDIELVPMTDADRTAARLAFALLAVAVSGFITIHAVRWLERAALRSQRAAEAAGAAAERKGSFLANISHELRTPLNAILGYSELVLESPACSEPQQREDLEHVREAGGSLLALINEVLHAARLDATAAADARPGAVAALVQSVVDGSKGALRGGAVDGSLGQKVVQADPERVQAIVGDVIEGFQREGLDLVDLEVRSAAEGVELRFVPRGPRPAGPDWRGVPLPWLLAERSAHAAGLRLDRRRDGSLALVVPPADSGRNRHRWFDRWIVGSAPLPADPLEAMRVRLAMGLAVMVFGLVTVVGIPIIATLDAPLVVSLLRMMDWWGFLGAVIALYRLGWHRVAGASLVGGLVSLLTIGLLLDAGASPTTILSYPLVAAIGVIIVGSRAGIAATVFVMAGLGVLGLAEWSGLVAPAATLPRADVAFGVVATTFESAVLVGTGAWAMHGIVRTADEAAERAQDAHEAASRFLSVVSGELRTPLHAILGYTELVLEDAEDPEMRDDLLRILDAGRHLLILVDDLLDMSAIVDDQLDVELATVDPRPLLEGVVSVVTPLVQQRDNVLEVALDPDVDHVEADPRRLKQILINLLSNSAKFTRGGRIRVAVRSTAGGMVEIAVEDQGIGIAASDLMELFRPFRQVHQARPGEYGGTGLGLAISRRLARKMGGDIRAESTLGVGSTFVVSLRAAPSASQAAEPSRPAAALAG